MAYVIQSTVTGKLLGTFSLVLAIMWLGGFLIGLSVGNAQTLEDGHEEQYSCKDMTDVSIKCRDETSGREWMMIRELSPPLIQVKFDPPYSEADVRYIACSFTSEGVFFCVNTKTGKIWTPTKRGVIV